ncbi:MAG: UvrD-helicase domain-containing protein [Gemmatimonadaceae bacterium]
MTAAQLPDQDAREHGATDLDANLIVEAGAGSGKTSLMALRIVNLIAAGRRPESIAAVTFTRKAAAELRERVQLELEKQGQDAGLATDVFISTIHSFCGRLIRERPIEAGLDPRFRELEQDEAEALALEWWTRWLDRLHLADDPLLVRVQSLGVEPNELSDAFKTFVRYPDVDFSAPACPVPDTEALVAKIDEFLEQARGMIPDREPQGGWDGVQQAMFGLRSERRTRDWTNPVELFESLGGAARNPKVTQKQWVRDTARAKEEKAAAKAFGADYCEWRQGAAEIALAAWREHRYAPIAQFLRRGANEFAGFRLATSQLSFEDLLLRAATLLRDNPTARRSLGERWRHVLVDEFQDTDPVQVEVLFLLGSEPDIGAEAPASWADVTLRPGALFAVGDPKQSIYRFRRADVETYEQAKQAIARQGAVLKLTANFRSRAAIATVVNAHFGPPSGALPPEPTRFQAAFAPLQPATPVSAEGDAGRVVRYEIVAAHGAAGKDVVIADDAAQVASWVAGETADERLRPQDVLILTHRKEALAYHARELAARGIPVSVSGAGVRLEVELYELQLLLALMRDPDNAVLVAAVSEGIFFGVSPADLWAAHQAGLALTVSTAAPAGVDGERAQRVRDALEHLHGWFAWYRDDAPDLFLSRVLDDTGLLAYTVASELGDVRAGILLRLVEDVRAASLDPELAGDAAHGTLERLLQAEAPDAPLLPGRTDAVRVMNLHKAKGLEGEVVILAAPTSAGTHEATHAIRRAGNRPVGGVVIARRNGRQTDVIAQPPGWAELQATEQQFADAEQERLRYVAATRARSTLAISEFVKDGNDGPRRQDGRQWSEFAPTLDALECPVLEMPMTPAFGRPVLTDTAGELEARMSQVEAMRRKAARPGWAHQTVSRAAKTESMEVRALDDVSREARGAGAAWGRAVHRCLEQAGRAGDVGVAESTLARIAEEELVMDRLEDLRSTVAAVTQREVWRAMMAAPARRQEWPVAGWVDRDGVPTYLEGVIDAAYRTDGGWHVIDWKTDAVPDEVWKTRAVAYERQLAMYAELLGKATGEAVTTELVRV